ncbi:MAG TPA: hypothetical protein ENO18_06445 [Caldithrix sp.]|nr:hypothetical protein [Caldithrix sp.]
MTERLEFEKELKKHRDNLEKLVKQRTEELENSNKELTERTKELEKFNKVMLDREFRIIEMKKEVNLLSKELGKDIVYPPVWEDNKAER